MPDPEIAELTLTAKAVPDLDLLSRVVFAVYDVRRDSARFSLEFKDGQSFDAMRKSYRERHELSSLKIAGGSPELRKLLGGLGFTLSSLPEAERGVPDVKPEDKQPVKAKGKKKKDKTAKKKKK